MIIDKEKLLHCCVTFVQQAALRGLQINSDFSTKVVAGGSSHVGSADMANTFLAESMFSEFGLPIIIEERNPILSDWQTGQGVILVDPIDGSAEIGTGGAQFAAGVSVYDGNGNPICGAAASPGIRPIFRVPSTAATGGFEFSGFGDELGAIVFGGPRKIAVLPLRNPNIHDAILVPAIPPRRLRDNPYSSISLDPNQAFLCGFKKALPGFEAGLAKMSFSNIFSQIQLVLGQTDIVTIGPTPTELVGGNLRGSKLWDLMLPLVAGSGVGVFFLDGTSTREMTQIDKSIVNDDFVFFNRIFLTGHDFHLENVAQIVHVAHSFGD